MIDILKKVFGDIAPGYKRNYVGNEMIILLDNDRRLSVRFCCTYVKDNYNTIKLELVSKTHGDINVRVVCFKDIFSCMQDLTHPGKLGKHIWYDRGKYDWYGIPTKEDIKAMRDTVDTYINIWE